MQSVPGSEVTTPRHMFDPYINTDMAVARLMDEYLTHKKLIIAVDFDDTVFDFHKKGYTYDKVVSLVKECSDFGFYIVLFTGTPEEQWPSQVSFMNNLGINIDSVNKNPIPLPFGNHGKPYWNILLDDRAGLGQAYETLRKVMDYIKQGEL